MKLDRLKFKKEFIEQYGQYIDKNVLDDCISEMEKAKDLAGMFEIMCAYTNLNFYRFDDDNTIVHSTLGIDKHIGCKDYHFDKTLAQPIINIVLEA